MNLYVEYANLINEDFPVVVFHNVSDAANMIVNPHIHDQIELLLLISGKALINIENNSFEMHEGDVAVLNKNVVHSVKGIYVGTTDFLVVQFELDILLNSLTAFNRKIINIFHNELDFFSVIGKDTAVGGKIAQLLLKIDRLKDFNGEKSRFEIISDLVSFVSICVGSIPKISSEKKTADYKDRTAMYKSLSYIKNNYDKKITIKEISDISGYSIPHYSRIIKKYTGMTFLDYLNNFRVNRVCIDIKKGMNISESAYNNGFNSLATFNRIFKGIHKVTPTQWIKINSGID
jgi:AraC-like DNA-binding protein